VARAWRTDSVRVVLVGDTHRGKASSGYDIAMVTTGPSSATMRAT
jgi:hypothetical protein